MKRALLAFAALALCAGATPLAAQQGGAANQPAVRPLVSEKYKTTYVRIGRGGEGLLFEPVGRAASTLALVYGHPAQGNFTQPAGPELAARGYRIMLVNSGAEFFGDDSSLPALSQALGYMRGLPGVSKVILIGHSGGGHLTTMYQNVAENGKAACSGAEKLFPCSGPLDNLTKPDGLVLLDPSLGAFHQMSALDPAMRPDGTRDPTLDMWNPANGYDPATKAAKYPADFIARFSAAQAKRNDELTNLALARWKAIQAGTGQFTNNEPFLVRGVGAGTRLYQPDRSLLSHTKKPHTLLKSDGTEAQTVIQSVRRASGADVIGQDRVLGEMNDAMNVRQFLDDSALRTTSGFKLTTDDIVGVDWASANDSAPSNAKGIKSPTLVLTMSCHYFIVTGEIIYDNLASADKTYASVEGAVHTFTPCGAQYGDTVKRTFDYVDSWLKKPGRFL
jgi:pimeloyl-ACP methyl ester carboxylesterase